MIKISRRCAMRNISEYITVDELLPLWAAANANTEDKQIFLKDYYGI